MRLLSDPRTGFALLFATALAMATTAPLDAQADDPNAIVFVDDRCGKKEGAPPAANLGTLVLLTDLSQQDAYYPVVSLLKKEKRPVATIRFPKGKISAVRKKLRKHLPEFVLVVTRPERIDANLHFELLEIAAALDKDPFVDFAMGYVTGATPAEALAFAQRIVKIGKRKKTLPKSVFHFGPSKNKALSEGGPIRHDLAKGWKKTWLYHGSAEEMTKRMKRLTGHGFLHAGGHGEPERVVDGLTGKQLREKQFDLSPAIYFSGPCYCGVTANWYKLQAGGIKRERADLMSSFALALIASRVTALFAGLDPDRLEQSSQEMEHLWIHGDALGHAMKETYDGTTIALRNAEYKLFRYKPGGPRPQKNLAMTMIGGGASRALYGDPTYVPFKPSAKPTFPVTTRDGKKALSIVWESRNRPTGWLAVDVYRCKGRWTNRISIREEIPIRTARALKSFVVDELVAKKTPLNGRFPTAMIERWGGKAYLHIYVVFEPGGLPTDVRKLRARFLFKK